MAIQVIIYQKWNQTLHGVSPQESQNAKLINYMEKKNFVMIAVEENELIYDGIEYYIDWYRRYNLDMTLYNMDNSILNPFDSVKISLGYLYTWKDRSFCREFKGIQKFQKMWREFHYKKLPKYKSIKNLNHRRLFGKFKR